MAEFNRPQSEEELIEHFAQLKPLMNDTEAKLESSRCLFCFDAPCIQACPTSIDIPLFIRQIYSDNLTGSAKTIYDSNYFGNICGKVCPTEVLCEGACVYNEQGVKPIEIGRLQSFATTLAQAEEKQLFEAGADNGKKVAVIGAGPAGIGAACELRKFGYQVEIFEAKDQPSGLTIYGVAPYKITNEEIIKEINYLQDQFGFIIHYNHPIENRAQIQRLEQSYDAIFLGIGLGNTRKLGIENEEHEGCIGATEFIEKLKIDPLNTKIGNKVVVIGGGNTAMDAASESARMGATEVYLAYRRSQEAMGAYEFEYDLAKNVGVRGLFNANPKAILTEAGKISGIQLIQTAIVDGKLVEVAGSEFVIECDMVIKATGQLKQKSLLDMMEGVEYDGGGRISVNEQFQTSNPKYFASGDAVNGGAEVVNAVGEAKKAAQAIHAILS